MCRKRFSYSPTQVRNALIAIQNGAPILRASKEYQVPRSTLRHKLRGEAPLTSGRVGPESILGPKIEQILVDWLLDSCRMGFPITKDGLVNTVKKLVESEHIKTYFTNNTPGRKWFEGFLKRHPIISQKKAEYLSQTRAAVTETFIRNWFSEVKNLLKEDLEILKDPQRVFNMDETAMCLAPKGGLFLAEKGKSTYYVSASSDKENITTLFTVNASGEIAPPLTIFKYERLPQACIDKAPPGWGIGKSENGWMTYVSFYEYFTNVFDNYLVDKNIPKPVIVFLDGHVSHLSYELSVFCKNHQIILCCLPPNATHILQPLDVAVFAVLKKQWQKFVKNWRTNYNGMDIQKFDVPKALAEIIEKEDFAQTIKAGFKCCGLYPFDPDGVNYEKCIKQVTSITLDVKEVVQSKSHADEQLLQQLEKNINSDILLQFKKLKMNSLQWNGETEYIALFNTWSRIYDQIHDINIIPDETSDTNNTQEFENIVNGTYIYK